MAPKVSERTCIVCRRKEPLPQRKRGEVHRSEGSMFRFVLQGGELLVDSQKRIPGRGAYVHRTVECVTKLLQAGKLAKTLRGAERAYNPQQARQVVQTLLELVASSIGVAGSEEALAGKSGRREGGEIRKSPRKVRL